MKRIFKILPWLILGVSFFLPAIFYRAVSGEILLYRSFFGGEDQYAPKSLFTVFRVPLIELICAAAIETMRRSLSEAASESDRNNYSMWTILLFAVAFKSLLQSLEFVASSVYAAAGGANFFYLATFAVVIGGIVSAALKGYKIFTEFRRTDWRLSAKEKTFLVVLLFFYLGLAILPLFIYKST